MLDVAGSHPAQGLAANECVVGIGEMCLSARPADVLITYSLGSCLGVTMYDPIARVGGLIHCMLPLSRIDPEKARSRPCMFTDTGVAALLRAMFDEGASRANLLVKAAGAATVLYPGETFRIGERNYAVLRKILWKNDMLVAASDLGGGESRTMILDVSSGRTYVRRPGGTVEL